METINKTTMNKEQLQKENTILQEDNTRDKLNMKKLKKHGIYEIEWTDTNGRTGWWMEEDLENETKKVEILNKTVGYFIRKSGSFYILSMSYCPVEGFAPYGAPKWIPIKTIKKIKLMKQKGAIGCPKNPTKSAQ
jgi:hypothetical protein